jgi:class 3 adenylate cyclase
MEQAAVIGISEGGPLSALFAATYPDRCRRLVLYGSFARGDPARSAAMLSYVDRAWGTGDNLPVFAPSRANDPAFQLWWGRFERLGASPAAVKALVLMNAQIDVSGILPSIRVPTLAIHRTGDQLVSVENGRFLAEHIPGARYIELPGNDHIPFVGENAGEIVDAIQEFLTGSRAPVEIDRVLATVLFTDIVGSTEKAAALGDSQWHKLLDDHHVTIRRNLARFRGHEIKSTGDGILATFDGPARGVRCACAIAEEIHPLGIDVRAGLHTGECEIMGEDVGGIAVHIGARVASLAGAGEVLVSRTVKDLVAGSGLRFADRGSQTLKGVPGDWQIYAVEQ